LDSNDRKLKKKNKINFNKTRSLAFAEVPSDHFCHFVSYGIPNKGLFEVFCHHKQVVTSRKRKNRSTVKWKE